jgi:hypothetical protein
MPDTVSTPPTLAHGRWTSSFSSPTRGAPWRLSVTSNPAPAAHLQSDTFADRGLEVAAPAAHAVLGSVHDSGVELIAQQHADRL